jgi:AhpD family alkylhydroperoxidase
MTQRLAYAHHSPVVFKKFLEFSNAIRQAGIDQTIYDLVDIRASQLNGCAFCLHGVSDEAYAQVSAQFSEKELADLTFLVMAINAWNRVNCAFKTPPGSADQAYGLDKANLS